MIKGLKMNIFSKIRTLDGFNASLDQLRLKGINWKGDKYFVYKKNETISMNGLIQKLDEIYHSECFRGAQLTEKDCEKIKAIKNKIEQLNNKKIKISKLKWLYIKLIGIASHIFLLGKVDKKSALLGEMSAKAERSDESVLLQNIVNTNLPPQVEDALKYSYDNYYKVPFKDSNIRKNEAVRSVDGEEIHRYNHGLAHTTRKVFFIPFVVDYLLRHGLKHLSKKLEGLIEEDGLDKVTQKLQIAIAFEVAGRESECGSRDNIDVYTNYLDKSEEAFKNYCKEKDLMGPGKLFKDESDVEHYSKAIKNKYHNKFKKDEMDVVTAILDMSHTLDEFRCYWPSRMKSELEEINHFYTEDKNNRDLWELAKFCQKAVRATGDRVMTEFSEGFNQRNNEFAFGDFTSLAFRNYTFSDKNAFINCSTDTNYCWDLLKKIPPPLSYSRGETTYSHLSDKTNEPSSVGAPFEYTSKGKEALDIISNGKAAIRLVNSKKEQWGFEMKMLNDPVFFRPVRSVRGERDWVLKNRTSGDLIYRQFKKRRSIEDQMKKIPEKESMLSNTSWKPVHNNKDRGLAKFTEFTKKLSFSLLRPDGKVNHFKGEFPKEYGSYYPVGFLYDVGELDQKNQKYIFDKDVGTSSKFWIGKEAAKNIKKKIGRETQLALEDLKKILKNEVENNVKPQSLPFWKMQHASNEMLMSPKKSAIKAVFATEDTSQARVRTFLHAVYLAQDFGVKVPVLVIDGVKDPKVYTMDDLKKDLEILSKQNSSTSKTIFKDLSSCFFSEMDKSIPPSSEEFSQSLLEHCQSLFS